MISTSVFLQFCISKRIVKHHKLNCCLFLFFPANCICLPSRWELWGSTWRAVWLFSSTGTHPSKKGWTHSSCNYTFLAVLLVFMSQHSWVGYINKYTVPWEFNFMRNSSSGSITKLLVSEFGTGRAELTAILVGKTLDVYRCRRRTEPWNHIGWKTPLKSLSQTAQISISALHLKAGAVSVLALASTLRLNGMFGQHLQQDFILKPGEIEVRCMQEKSETLGLHHLKDHKM